MVRARCIVRHRRGRIIQNPRAAGLNHVFSGFLVQTLTLLVGNAFLPHVADQDRRYATIESFLSRSEVVIHRHTSTAGWICSALGVKRRPDWPIGAILTHTYEAPDDGMYWICADPVHLAVDRDSLVLQPQAQMQLSEAESLAIFSSLEAHFATDGLRLVHVDTGRWCIGTRRRPHLVTSDLELVEGRSVDDVLPSGQDAPIWQRYITEAQMILVDHPVNAAREARGEAVVNSIWMWGGGIVPEATRSFDNMSVSDSLLREIGKLSGTSVNASHGAGIDFHDMGNCFAEFPGHATSDDENGLARLESDWMVPAWQALRRGELDKVTLVLRLDRSIVECSCERMARRNFWKRRRPLPDALARIREAA